MISSEKSYNESQHASESEEEESSSEENEEQEGSESEFEEEAAAAKTLSPKSPVIKKPLAPKIIQTTEIFKESSSSSSEEAESESDSPPEGFRKADQNIRPIASKPMDGPSKTAKKPRSKPSVPTSPSSSKPVKRPAENEVKDSRKTKRKVSDVNNEESEKKTAPDDTKRQLFQRTFSEDDEIAILNGMIDFKAKKGSDPAANMNGFHDFIKKSLHVDVSKIQLMDKVRRLKKKYANKAVKEKKGKERNLKSYEQQAYELSKKIWDSEGNNVAVVDTSKDNGTAGKSRSQRADKFSISIQVNGIKMNQLSASNLSEEMTNIKVGQDVEAIRSLQIRRGIGDPSLEEEIIKDGLELIKGPRRVELEEKWKQLHLEEVELYLKRMNLIHEQTILALEALKSGFDNAEVKMKVRSNRTKEFG